MPEFWIREAAHIAPVIPNPREITTPFKVKGFYRYDSHLTREFLEVNLAAESGKPKAIGNARYVGLTLTFLS